MIQPNFGKSKISCDKIWRTKITDAEKLDAGEIKIVGKKLFVGTGEGTLEVLESQAPNTKKVSAADFINGRKNFTGKFN